MINESLKIAAENLTTAVTSLEECLKLKPYIVIPKQVNERSIIQFYIVSDLFKLVFVRKQSDLYVFTHKYEFNALDLNEKPNWVHQSKLDIKIYSDGSAFFENEQLIVRNASIGRTTERFNKLNNFGEDYFDVLESTLKF